MYKIGDAYRQKRKTTLILINTLGSHLKASIHSIVQLDKCRMWSCCRIMGSIWPTSRSSSPQVTYPLKVKYGTYLITLVDYLPVLKTSPYVRAPVTSLSGF